MPTLDKERGVLVVRVVYDGPPLSGKTTTLKALARSLGVPITSPQEKEGRTLFFDWVDYIGGLFEGRQIRCQLLSVPGQEELANRRQYVLEAADAVVVVADTREREMGRAFDHLRSVLAWSRSKDPPVGVVLQANKRDAPDAVPRAKIQEVLATIAPIAIIDTVATSGDGIREAFVFGVRLALDRVRALAATGQLKAGVPDVDTPAQLLDLLTPLPADSIRPPPATEPSVFHELEQLAPYHSRPPKGASSVEGGVDERVFVPDPMMPGGFIWPPVDGRMLLHEVAHLDLSPVRTPHGDWWASGAGWRFHSAASSLFEDADLGRHGLIEWARLHASNLQRLSPGRTVILADAGDGRFRLWQLVRVAQALRERLATLAAECDADQLAAELHDAAAHVLRARRAFHSAGIGLPCTLWTVSGEVHRQPMFVGLMPTPGHVNSDHSDDTELVEREFGPLLFTLKNERRDYASLVRALRHPRKSVPDAVSEKLTRLAELRAAS